MICKISCFEIEIGKEQEFTEQMFYCDAGLVNLIINLMVTYNGINTGCYGGRCVNLET